MLSNKLSNVWGCQSELIQMILLLNVVNGDNLCGICDVILANIMTYNSYNIILTQVYYNVPPEKL